VREKVEKRENNLKRELASTQGQFPRVELMWTRDQYIVPMILLKMSVATTFSHQPRIFPPLGDA
jgi:hypothetical protein